MAPDFSWPFFNVLESRIRARHKPARDKRNVKLSDELLGLGLLLIEKATALTIGRRRSDERGASVRPVRRIWRTIARVWKAVTDPKWKIDGLGISALGVASTKRARRADGAASLRRGLPPQMEAAAQALGATGRTTATAGSPLTQLSKRSRTLAWKSQKQ